MSLPDTIKIAQARLPASYESAKTALATCASVDECKDWADKAAALATYAKMAEDDALQRLARRIQARAVQRMGEILKEFGAQGKRTDRPSIGADTKSSPPSQAEVARDAGLSKRQQVTAVRVANVPRDI